MTSNVLIQIDTPLVGGAFYAGHKIRMKKLKIILGLTLFAPVMLFLFTYLVITECCEAGFEFCFASLDALQRKFGRR